MRNEIDWMYIGVKYQIATKETSFVAVAEREEAVEGNMVQSVVPSTTETMTANFGGKPATASYGGGPPPPRNVHSAAPRSPSSKLAQVQREVDQVKNVMHQNIAMALERSEKLDMLEEKSERLSQQSASFAKGAQLKKVNAAPPKDSSYSCKQTNI